MNGKLTAIHKDWTAVLIWPQVLFCRAEKLVYIYGNMRMKHKSMTKHWVCHDIDPDEPIDTVPEEERPEPLTWEEVQELWREYKEKGPDDFINESQ